MPVTYCAYGGDLSARYDQCLGMREKLETFAKLYPLVRSTVFNGITLYCVPAKLAASEVKFRDRSSPSRGHLQVTRSNV
jgi:hypothetical protein